MIESSLMIIIILLNTVIIRYLPIVSSQTILVDSLACRDFPPRDTIQAIFHAP